MTKNEIVALIETMNNYDELAAKAKAKADAIRVRTPLSEITSTGGIEQRFRRN